MTTTWWDPTALAVLTTGDEAAVIEYEQASAIDSLATVDVDTLSMITVGSRDLRPQRVRRWRVLRQQITTQAVSDELISSAAGLVEELELPALFAWQLAGAMRSDVERVVSVHDDLLVAAQFFGFRVAHLQADWS